MEAEVFPSVLTSLRDPDEYVRKNTATLIREIAKHTPEVRRQSFCKEACVQWAHLKLSNSDNIVSRQRIIGLSLIPRLPSSFLYC